MKHNADVADSDAVEVIRLTAMLRQPDPPTGYFAGLRRCLAQRKIDPEDVLLVESFDDDENLVFGVLLTREGTPVTFDYRYPDEARMHEGTLTRWDEITSTWAGSPYAPGIGAAMRLLTTPGH